MFRLRVNHGAYIRVVTQCHFSHLSATRFYRGVQPCTPWLSGAVHKNLALAPPGEVSSRDGAIQCSAVRSHLSLADVRCMIAVFSWAIQPKIEQIQAIGCRYLSSGHTALQRFTPFSFSHTHQRLP
jgi:hypothetical protein